MNRKLPQLLLAAFLLMTFSGCIQEDFTGGVRTFTYEFWVPLSVLLLGIASVPVGWYLRNRIERIGWTLMVVGPIATIFFAPSLFRDRAIVGEESFSLRTGIWGLTSVHEVPYDQLDMVRITSTESVGRRGRRSTNYYLMCEQKEGKAIRVPMSNSIAQAAAPYFLQKVEELGILVVDETQ